jgi:hypothetical protein
VATGWRVKTTESMADRAAPAVGTSSLLDGLIPKRPEGKGKSSPGPALSGGTDLLIYPETDSLSEAMGASEADTLKNPVPSFGHEIVAPDCGQFLGLWTGSGLP